jgi:hypothetical protein
MTAQELGAMGEYYAAQVLRSVGLRVRFDGPADLLADGVPIEVKAARPGRYRKGRYTGYQFCLTKPGHTDHSKAAVVILLCYWHAEREPVAFVIPSEAIGDRCKVVIPGQPWTYSGQWARYYRRWETIADHIS